MTASEEMRYWKEKKRKGKLKIALCSSHREIHTVASRERQKALV